MAEFIKVTGLYETKDKNGNTYYRGTARDGKTYWMTPNRNKKANDKYPDMELAYTEADPNYKKGGTTQESKPYTVQPVAQVTPEVEDSDVPF